ncbi:hypothetical protein NPIL_598011 [Nephila pilipes]|uniref:Uncharacterized protein n=1 Tax=Nephila pilipes TaxID=299642 RepID=A0A8X6PG47_NEPPI|nr:hypothetical protein NPIL_598011 [Nephila pilipes]
MRWCRNVRRRLTYWSGCHPLCVLKSQRLGLDFEKNSTSVVVLDQKNLGGYVSDLEETGVGRDPEGGGVRNHPKKLRKDIPLGVLKRDTTRQGVVIKKEKYSLPRGKISKRKRRLRKGGDASPGYPALPEVPRDREEIKKNKKQKVLEFFYPNPSPPHPSDHD